MKIFDFQDAENLRFSCITGKTRNEIEKILDKEGMIELNLNDL